MLNAPPVLDLVIAHGTVVTMSPRREVLVDTDVLVRAGEIVALGKRLAKRRGRARVLDARGMVVIPGLVHGHLHACQSLFRNQADGLELLDWLKHHIWPLEGAHDARSMRASADLTFAELIKGGSTAALDMGSVHHYGAVFESARDCGFRLTGGKAMMDAGDEVPASLRETTEDSLANSEALIRAWHGAVGGRLRYAFAPRFALSCSERLLREVAHRARSLGVRIHTHASENASECNMVRVQTGRDNVDYLASLGLCSEHTTLAHCVWLSAHERKTLARSRTVVCHCPSSNLKLASGIARVPELLAQGVRCALGADGAPCNNNLDMFVEMRLAALLHKPRAGATAMGPMQVLELATLGGACALGLESSIGSLEVGKRADVAVVDLRALHSVPAGDDVAAQLVYSARASDVRHVVIDGEIVMREGRLLTLDEPRVMRAASVQATRVADRASGGRSRLSGPLNR